jgi:hypothetical protein
MFATTLLIAGLSTAFYYWREQISVPADIDAAVAVLILVPALIGYVVIRPSDPPLSRRYILGAQLLSLAASAVPLVMAVLLLRFSGDPDDLQTAWLWSMRTSWLFALLLFVSLLRAGVRD